MNERAIYQVDAFTDRLFGGNPAAVVPLPAWPEDALLQAVAAENNLAETAYVVAEGTGYRIRWFTPEVEVNLCGHATLAAAWVVFRYLQPERRRVEFLSRSGPLTVTEESEGLLTLDFPATPATPCAAPEGLTEALGAAPVAVSRSRDLLVELGSEDEVRRLRPEVERLRYPETLGVIVTARGSDCDFVSRFFAPGAGIAEDPVTGSAHCTLVPYWSPKLGRRQLRARQVSARGGELWCEDRGDRVAISGRAVLYLRGTIYLPD